MHTVITSSGLITNEYPGLSANPHECHDFSYQVLFTEDDVKEHIEWYTSDTIPLGLEIDPDIGIITGKIYPLHKQPDCQDNLSPKEDIKVDGSNRNNNGLYNDSTHTFEFTVYRKYYIYEELFDYMEDTDTTTIPYIVDNRIQNTDTRHVYLCIKDSELGDMLTDTEYFTDITDVEEIAESTVSILVIKSGNIANTIFMESMLDTEDKEINNLVLNLDGSVSLEILIDRAHITLDGVKYYKEDSEALFNTHPGPFSKCPITD